MLEIVAAGNSRSSSGQRCFASIGNVLSLIACMAQIVICRHCGSPGTQEARDWLAVRDTLASFLSQNLAKRSAKMQIDHPIFSFTDLPAFDNCPLGGLALRLAAVQALDLKTDLLLRYSFRDEWMLLSSTDLYDLARSGWGTVIFSELLDLQVRACEEMWSTCATVPNDCTRCEWDGGQYYGFKEAVQLHIALKEEHLTNNPEAQIGACDWESATGLAALLWAHLQVFDSAVDMAPSMLRRLQGVMRCVMPGNKLDDGQWLAALLLTNRPIWGLLMVVSDILERETMKDWDAHVQSPALSSQTSPVPELRSLTQELKDIDKPLPLGSHLLLGIDGDRRYLSGVKLCAGVARAIVLPGSHAGYTDLVATVVGVSIFQAPPGSGRHFLEFPLMLTGLHTSKKHWIEAYGTWQPIEDRACQASPASQFVQLFCIWPADEGGISMKTRAALTRGAIIRPVTLELVACEVPAAHERLFELQKQGFAPKPFLVEVGGKRWADTVPLQICIEARPNRPWLTLCTRPWFDSSGAVNSTLQQFIEYHAALGVDRFHIVDSDGTALEPLRPYLQGRAGLINYHNATLNSWSLPELAGSTGNLRYPNWAVYPLCQSFYFAHCLFSNRDSHWIIHVPFFDKFLTGAPGMRLNVLRYLLTSSALRFSRPGMTPLAPESNEIGAVNIHRPSVVGYPEAPEEMPLTQQYFVRRNLSKFSPVCGHIHMYRKALVPIYRPHNVLLPSSGHWLWLRWGKWQCFVPPQRVWVNHYVKLGGKSWRNDSKLTAATSSASKDLNAVAAAIKTEQKRSRGYDSILDEDNIMRDESLAWTGPWFARIAGRAPVT